MNVVALLLVGGGVATIAYGFQRKMTPGGRAKIGDSVVVSSKDIQPGLPDAKVYVDLLVRVNAVNGEELSGKIEGLADPTLPKMPLPLVPVVTFKRSAVSAVIQSVM